MTIDELQSALEQAPGDEALREKAARALSAAGRHAEAAALLCEALINLTVHDGPVLPCLCRRCFEPRLIEAEEGGIRFSRDFAVAKGRVLFFWVPEELGDWSAVCRSVAAAMRSRLNERL